MALYATKQEVMVATGKLNDFEGFSGRLVELLSRQSGLLRTAVLNSFAYPAKYVFTSLWESRDAARTFGHSADLTKLIEEMQQRLNRNSEWENTSTSCS